MTFWGLSNERVYGVFQCSYTLYFCLVFDSEQLFGPKAHGLGCWVGRAEAMADPSLGRFCGAHGSMPLWSVGLAQTICWH